MISPIANDVASTTVYTRLVAGKSAATYLSTLSITSPSATTVTVNLEGIVDVTVGANGLLANNFKVSSSNGSVNVSGVAAGQVIEVYNGLGQKLKSVIATSGDNRIELSVRGVHVVKVGATAKKIALR